MQQASGDGFDIAYATSSVKNKQKEMPGQYHELAWNQVPKTIQAAAAQNGWEHFGQINGTYVAGPTSKHAFKQPKPSLKGSCQMMLDQDACPSSQQMKPKFQDA